MTPQEEQKFRELEQKVAKLEQKFPLDLGTKGAIENATFSRLKVLSLTGGLPIFTAARTGQGQGEEYIRIVGGSPYHCIYYSGAEYCGSMYIL